MATRRVSNSVVVSGRRARRRAATSSGAGAARFPSSEPVDLDRLRTNVLVAGEVLPALIAGRVDAARLEREVLRVCRLAERLLEGDQLVLPELHERLVEGLHAIGGVAARDHVAQLALPLGDAD